MNYSPKRTLYLAMVALAATFAFSQDQEAKPKHVITNEDLPSASAPSSSQSYAPAPSSASDSATKDRAKTDDQGTAASPDSGTMSADEMKLHQAGGVDPNETPKDAIKRIDREENELRSKLDQLRDKAANEKSESRRQMWLEAVDRQQTTLQQMAEEKAKIQKEEEEKAQQQGGQNADSQQAPEGQASNPDDQAK